jgi:D-sedoheptulose 7-phosphate isomerase
MTKNSLQESARLLDDMSQRADLVESISEVSSLCSRTLFSGNKLMFAGNGGSASQAEHIAGEFVGRFLKERRALAAMSLTGPSASLTAIANDYGYEDSVVRQLEAFGKSDDVLIVLSTSGESKNLIKACEYAKEHYIPTVALVGGKPSTLSKMCDYAICVPSTSTPRIQEVHIVIGHIIAERVENVMFGRSF